MNNFRISFFALFASFFLGSSITMASTTSIEQVRQEISDAESSLLQSGASKKDAKDQLKKIKKLIQLQKKEIQATQVKINEIKKNIDSMQETKNAFARQIETKKNNLYIKIKQLIKASERDSWNASWLYSLDAESQRDYILSKILEQNIDAVRNLKKNKEDILEQEIKMFEEKNRLEFYVQELNERNELLSVNEDTQTEILKSNQSRYFESLKKMQSLRESEKQLEKVMVKNQENKVKRTLDDLAVSSLVSKRGKLDLPVTGTVVTQFGKSYDKKSNLYTFQKGIGIRASEDTDVKAVADGRVVFSGPMKNYGQIVIVEHPGQYFTLYGQLGKVDVSESRVVKAGDRLGVSTAEPVYFEIRNKNIAMNPMQWIADKSSLDRREARL